MARLRIGILGAARIARLFADSVRPSRKIAITALAARDVIRAQGFAAELRIPRVHASYEALLADPEIDAIYNPLPNTFTPSGRSGRSTQASTCCAKSRSR